MFHRSPPAADAYPLFNSLVAALRERLATVSSSSASSSPSSSSSSSLSFSLLPPARQAHLHDAISRERALHRRLLSCVLLPLRNVITQMDSTAALAHAFPSYTASYFLPNISPDNHADYLRAFVAFSHLAHIKHTIALPKLSNNKEALGEKNDENDRNNANTTTNTNTSPSVPSTKPDQLPSAAAAAASSASRLDGDEDAVDALFGLSYTTLWESQAAVHPVLNHDGFHRDFHTFIVRVFGAYISKLLSEAHEVVAQLDKLVPRNQDGGHNYDAATAAAEKAGKANVSMFQHHYASYTFLQQQHAACSIQLQQQQERLQNIMVEQLTLIVTCLKNEQNTWKLNETSYSHLFSKLSTLHAKLLKLLSDYQCTTYVSGDGSSSTVQTLSFIHKELEALLADRRQQITQYKQETKLYNQLGQGFTALVHEYTQLKKQIEHKQWTLKNLEQI